MGQLLILLPFLAVFYFLLIRPQQKRQKEHAQMVLAVAVDDDIVTIGGLHGTVVALDEETMDVAVNADTVVRLQRSALARVVIETEGELDEAASDSLDAGSSDDAAAGQ